MARPSPMGNLWRTPLGFDPGRMWLRARSRRHIRTAPATAGLGAALRGWRIAAPRSLSIGVCVPAGTGRAGQRALEDAAFAAGARRVVAVDAPLAAAIGAGLPVDTRRGRLVADLGATGVRAALIADGTVIDVRVSAHRAHPDDLGWIAMITGLVRDLLRDGRVEALDAGVSLVGGGAEDPAAVAALRRALPIEVRVAADPTGCAAQGALVVASEAAIVERIARRSSKAGSRILT